MRWDVALHKYVPDLPLEKGAAEKKQEEEKQEKPEKTEEVTKEPEEKKGLFGTIKEKITTKKISREQFEKIFWDMEVSLLENNIAVEVIEKIKEDLTEKVVEKPLARGKIEEIITGSLAGSIREILKEDSFSLIERVKEKKPFVVCFVGINGSGKTTTIAKVAKMLLDKGLSVVLAASDTFRAASIEQLQLHADKLGVKLIKHNYGSDPAAVAFDAVKYAKSKSVDVVLIDTAGRIHSNVNLKDEMKKIIRISKPDLKIFVGESITGNDCVEQAKNFNEAIGIDGIILSKADIDEKGGAAVSVSYVTKKPIIYRGTGQESQDLKEFDSSLIVDSLGIQ
ncbi:signal recognition particle-docking protein FtsY [Candidatus Woesearchaeota archaeon]|nr:signal recognition particle-docking protein FtsY [Candidatus Woesearchaeota archaeon]